MVGPSVALVLGGRGRPGQLNQLPVIDEHRLDFFAAKVGYITGTHFEAFDFGDLPFGGVQLRMALCASARRFQ